MPIVTSEAIQDSYTQPGGGRYVIERHTDQAGRVYQVGPYLVAPGFDVQAALTARATQINDDLAAAEARELIGG